MIIRVHMVRVECDKCGKGVLLPGWYSMSKVHTTMKRDGWVSYANLTLCPKCKGSV